jgi:hypothetical protein
MKPWERVYTPSPLVGEDVTQGVLRHLILILVPMGSMGEGKTVERE